MTFLPPPLVLPKPQDYAGGAPARNHRTKSGTSCPCRALPDPAQPGPARPGPARPGSPRPCPIRPGPSPPGPRKPGPRCPCRLNRLSIKPANMEKRIFCPGQGGVRRGPENIPIPMGVAQQPRPVRNGAHCLLLAWRCRKNCASQTNLYSPHMRRSLGAGAAAQAGPKNGFTA